MSNYLYCNGKRLFLLVIAIMMAGCLYAVKKTAVFDFSNPSSLVPALSVIPEVDESSYIRSDVYFEDKDIRLDMIVGTSTNMYIKNNGGNFYLGLKNGNQIKIVGNSDLLVSRVIFCKAEGRNNIKSSDFLYEYTSDKSDPVPLEDGSLEVPGNLSGVKVTTGVYTSKIEIEYEIEEPELPEIKDMPTDVLKTEFSDFDGTVGEQTDYVFVAGNVVATGNLLENGHLEVVRFADGVKSFPVDYAFRFKELYAGEYVIQNKRNEYLSAGENGHFALTTSDEEALLWNVSVDGSKVEISETGTSRAAGQSILFSESAGGFGLYDAGGESVAPTVYAYTSPTTAIAELVENDDAEAVYYDLRGNVVDIEQCTPGIYICRKGIKVTKVAIK